MSAIKCSGCGAESYNGPRVVLYCKSCYELIKLEYSMLQEAYKELKEKYERLQSVYAMASWIYQEPEHTDGIHIETTKRYSFTCEGCRVWTCTWATEQEAVDEANRLGIAWAGGKVLCKKCRGA